MVESQDIIVYVANSLGYILEDIFLFFINVSVGWMSILVVLAVGFIIAVYFRFFRKIIVGRRREL